MQDDNANVTMVQCIMKQPKSCLQTLTLMLALFNIWCLIIGLNDAFLLGDSVGAILVIGIQGNDL
jgi:hypothetical protein